LGKMIRHTLRPPGNDAQGLQQEARQADGRRSDGAANRDVSTPEGRPELFELIGAMPRWHSCLFLPRIRDSMGGGFPQQLHQSPPPLTSENDHSASPSTDVANMESATRELSEVVGIPAQARRNPATGALLRCPRAVCWWPAGTRKTMLRPRYVPAMAAVCRFSISGSEFTPVSCRGRSI